MTHEPFNRRLALLTAFFAFLGVILGVLALATDYWTITRPVELYHNETSTFQLEHGYRWNLCLGLFQVCQIGQSCFFQFRLVTFILGVVGIFLLLIGGILSALNILKATNRCFITPLFIFIARVLLTAALVDYALSELLNSHSSRAMIATVIFANTALALSAYVAGRYSIIQRLQSTNDEVHRITQKYSVTNGKDL